MTKKINSNLLYTFFIFLAIVIFVIIKFTKGQEKTHLSYTLTDGFTRQSQQTFHTEIDNAKNNADKSVVKKVADIGQGVLYIHNANIDEQIIVFEEPCPLIKNENEANNFLDFLSTEFEKNFNQAECSYTLLNRGKEKFKNKYDAWFIYSTVKFDPDDVRYAFFYVLCINHNYYPIIINTYNKANTINNAFVDIQAL